MNFTTFYSMFFALFTALSVYAAVVPIQQSDVWVPMITSPTSGTRMTVGQTFLVTWDTSNAPAQVTNPIGAIFLRLGNTATPLILAGNFPLMAGSVSITVPWVMNRTDYTLVLMGDSGNWSPPFAITGPSPF